MKRALVSHPNAALISQHVAAGLELQGRLAAYVTGWAVAERWMPQRLWQMAGALTARAGNRRVPQVSPRRVWPLLLPEAVARAGAACAARPAPRWQWYDAMFVSHDAMVSALPWPDADAVVAYEDAARRTFARAANRGMARVYDLPSPYFRAPQAVLAEEMARWPGAQPADVVEEPLRKHRWKDQELLSADLVLVASQYSRRCVEDAAGLRAPVAVVPYGFPVEDFPARTHKPTGPFTVLVVGRVELRKGSAHLLTAWKHAALKDARLHLVGAMRLEPGWLTQLGVTFEHTAALPRAQLGALYQQADLVVFPSLCDGFGLVIQEAMASGTPVLATTSSGGPQCIEHGVDGMLVAPADAEALAAALRHAAAHRDELFAMGQRAAQRARTWTWGHYQRAVTSVITAFMDGQAWPQGPPPTTRM